MRSIRQLQDIIRATGRSKTTILQWEARGKIPAARRDEHGWRYWTEEDYQKAVSVIHDLPLRHEFHGRLSTRRKNFSRGSLSD